jgi:hypothetical protein
MSSRIFVLRGRIDILRVRPALMRLCVLCEQTGAVDYLEHFLTTIENIKKTPHLLLFASRPTASVFDLQAENLRAAVLVYEYRLLGVSSRIFISSEFAGSRAIIAPPALRAMISTLACRYLMEHGAEAVLVSYMAEVEETCQTCLQDAMTSGKKRWWTTQTREAGATIELEKTVNATLAKLGSQTRRNLKRYRRKAEEDLGCSFVRDVRDTLTRPQLSLLNLDSTHPVPAEVIDRRFHTIRTLEGAFCIGAKSGSGQWISLLAGRRHHGVTAIDWQLNRDSLAKYSVGTVIRAYLIEYEISLGSKKLYFEGGTPHTIRHSFVPEKAKDIMVLNRSPFAFLLRACARYLSAGNNFLLQTLADPTLQWEQH